MTAEEIRNTFSWNELMAITDEGRMQLHLVMAIGELAAQLAERKATESKGAISPSVLAAILRVVQEDGHTWSTRPCESCRAVTSLAGAPFGCVLYAQRSKLR